MVVKSWELFECNSFWSHLSNYYYYFGINCNTAMQTIFVRADYCV